MSAVRPMEERDRERLVSLHALAFQVPEYRLERQRTLALSEGWVVTDDQGAVTGGLRAEALGQWFGGRSVTSAIVTSVKIAPEARGAGYARRLMAGTLEGLRSRGSAISVLYPSTPGVYRSVGYELAGSSVRYRLPPGVLPKGRGLAIRPFGDSDVPRVEACYRRFAKARAGLIDRTPGWWRERILDPFLDHPPERYLVEDETGVAGYLIFGHGAAPGLPYGMEITAIDLIWTTPAAARTLVGFGGALGPLAESFGWPGPAREPLGALIDSRAIAPHAVWPWMLRILDVERALTARGYREAVSGSVAFECLDGVLAANAGPRRIAWRDGTATVEPVREADLKLDVRGLAALYTGWLGPSELADLGLLEGGSPSDWQLLESAFRGPDPWMVEIV